MYQTGGGTAELVIENATKAKTGAFLRNRVKGRTEFAYALDSVYEELGLLKFKRGTDILAFNFNRFADTVFVRDDSMFYVNGGVEFFIAVMASADVSGKVNITDTASMLDPYLLESIGAATYAPLTRTINNGYGILGGGNLSTDRTLRVDTGELATILKVIDLVASATNQKFGVFGSDDRFTSNRGVNMANRDMYFDSIGQFDFYAYNNDGLTAWMKISDGSIFQQTLDPVTGNTWEQLTAAGSFLSHLDWNSENSDGDQYMYLDQGHLTYGVELYPIGTVAFTQYMQDYRLSDSTVFSHIINQRGAGRNIHAEKILLDVNGIQLWTKTNNANTYKGLRIDTLHQVFIDSMAMAPNMISEKVVVINSSGHLRYIDKDSVGTAGAITSETDPSALKTAGDLSPLFTTTEAANNLSFSLSNASAYTVFGRGSGSGAPSYLSSLDSNWIPGLHTEAYYNTKYMPIGSSSYTDEQAQDAVGAMINSTLTYNDATPSLGINLGNANTWTADQSVPDEAYDATGWNGSTEVPTKNAIRDKIETLGSGGNVTKVGTPVNNQLGVWTGDGTIEGTSDLNFDGTYLGVGGSGTARITAIGAAGLSSAITLVNTTDNVKFSFYPASIGVVYGVSDGKDHVFATYSDPGGLSGYTELGRFNTNGELIQGTTDNGAYKFQANGNSFFVGESQHELQLKLKDISPPSTPASGYGALYVNSDRVVFKDDGGTANILAYLSEIQPLDADLTYLAGFTPSANVKTILNAADYAAIRTALGLTDADKGDITISSNFSTFTIDNSAVTLAKIANISDQTFLGNNTGGSAAPVALTATQAKTVLSLNNVDNTSDATKNSATATLTNKRIAWRSPAITQSATPAINTDVTDYAEITGLAQAITSMTTNLTGTPVKGDKLWISITDNGTARAITWGASFEASTVALPTTTVISTRLDVGFMWNVATTKWRCVAVQ